MLVGMETQRTAVITGASRGLGAGIAEELARQGWRLGVCSRGETALAGGERLLAERVDVTDEPALRAFARRVAQRFGGVDLWINNAGVTGPLGPLRDAEHEEIAQTIAVNLAGVVHGTRAFLEVGGGKGVLVNMSSGAGRTAYPGMAMYCATKAAVDRLSETVQLEQPGMRVLSVSPGLIETDMQVKIRARPESAFPMVGWFREVKRREAFSSPAWVARQILAAVDAPPGAGVVVDLPMEHALP